MNAMMLARLLVLVCTMALAVVAQERHTPRPGRFDPAIEQTVAQYLDGKAEFEHIHFGVDDSVVTITGSVRLHSERLRLESQVRGMRHVIAVRSFVLLDPVPVSDDLLSGRIRSALRGANLDHLQVVAHEGRVELAGDVQDRQQWSRAVNLVWETPGVREAEFRIRVRGNEH